MEAVVAACTVNLLDRYGFRAEWYKAAAVRWLLRRRFLLAATPSLCGTAERLFGERPQDGLKRQI